VTRRGPGRPRKPCPVCGREVKVVCSRDEAGHRTGSAYYAAHKGRLSGLLCPGSGTARPGRPAKPPDQRVRKGSVSLRADLLARVKAECAGGQSVASYVARATEEKLERDRAG
jgi:hypothetical protein